MTETLLRRAPVTPTTPALGTTAPAVSSGVGDTTGVGGEFLRRPEPPKRKRRHPLLALVRPLIAALVLVALPLGIAGFVLTAPPFQLRDIDVEGGGTRVPETWAHETLAPFQGENLVRLPLSDVAARLRKNPWVDAVEIQKELPGRLRVALTERKPVALLRTGGGLVYADSAGRPIVPISLEEARRSGLRLEVRFVHPGAGNPAAGMDAALKVAGELGRVQPDWAAALTRIEVLGEEDFILYTEALRFPLVVTRGQVGPKARRLKEILPELERRYPAIERVDLRFSRRIVVQPAVPGQSGDGPQISLS
jgi:POTRA domain, FtsQ-type